MKIRTGFRLVCSLLLQIFVPDLSLVRAEKHTMLANTSW